jgi:hypothetical protein
MRQLCDEVMNVHIISLLSYYYSALISFWHSRFDVLVHSTDRANLPTYAYKHACVHFFTQVVHLAFPLNTCKIFFQNHLCAQRFYACKCTQSLWRKPKRINMHFLDAHITKFLLDLCNSQRLLKKVMKLQKHDNGRKVLTLNIFFHKTPTW